MDVEVPYEDQWGGSDNTAQLLLTAAAELGLDPAVVKTTSRGVFLVPPEVAATAFRHRV